mmetsp:Transcript_27386/g.63222  ORF Transcript_27386/g.63222 Transcript_27386/m.63222 type:complete len:913 (+) Transcript_27386:93-2831(+)
MARGNLALLTAVLLALPARGQKLVDIMDVGCTGAGSSESTRLVGPQYYAVAKESGDPHWSTYVLANDSAAPVLVKNGCPAYYGMLHEDMVHFKVERSTEDSSMLALWECDRWYTVPKMSWEQQRIPEVNNFDYYLWYQRLFGEVTWHPDTNYWFFHGNWDGANYPPHMGATDHMVVDLTSDLEGSTPSVYEGKWYFIFHQHGSKMVETDYDALKQLYMDTCAPHRNGTASDRAWVTDWNILHHMLVDDWNYDTMPYCDWMKGGWNETYIKEDNMAHACNRIEDVVCDFDGHVNFISINEGGLKGQLPAALGNMMNLNTLRLRWNNLEGTVPPIFMNHDKLRELDLHHNLLSGPLPCFAGDHELVSIQLSRNLFTGTLWSDSCITDATTIAHIFLYANDLSGSLPDWSSLKKLAWLDLHKNHIEGSIPTYMCGNTAMNTLTLHTNQIVGSFPHGCINPDTDGTTGWERLYHMDITYNRMTGSLPVFGPNMLNLKRVFLDYNYFEGLVDTQFDVIIDHSEQSALTEVSLVGNRLSGPFPPVVYRMLTDVQALNHLYVDDNLFRCENNGEFPPWALKSYARGNSGSLFSSHSVDHGMCKPVPNPTSLTPTSGEVGTVIKVYGRDILPDANGLCQFYMQSGNTVAYSRAKVRHTTGTAPYVECSVPSSLSSEEERTFSVTISNYGQDFATAAYWQGSTTTFNPPTFAITPVEVMESGVVVSTQFNLVDVTPATFNEADFRQMVADIAGVPVKDVQISLTPPTRRLRATLRLRASETRRMQTTLPVYVSINVPVSDPNSAEAQAIVNNIAAAITNTQNVEEVMERYNFEVDSTGFEVEKTEVEPVYETVTKTETKKEDDAMLGIIIAAAVSAVACCLCGFVGFIRYREKKGQPYFKETLDEGGAGGGNTGASYGNTV